MDLSDIDKTKQELIDFEDRIASLYKEGKILAPVHLAGGNEDRLIDIFKSIDEDDWVCTSYRSHFHALLKGINQRTLEERIVGGGSMFIMSKEHKFLSSAIVPGQLPIALGIAQGLKLKDSPRKVWAFCGDMAAETGVFYECAKYAACNNLPINFIVEDDGLSVYTPTRQVWGGSVFSSEDRELKGYQFPIAQEIGQKMNILKYSYQRKWAHHGIGLWVDFPNDNAQDDANQPMYKDELSRAMKMLAENKSVIFIGQTVAYKGSPVYGSLDGIGIEKKIELPIMEEVQMGMSTGLSLVEYTPVSVYPRIDFLTLATNQMVNHLDKMEYMSCGEFKPKVLIRTAIGSKEPLNGGPQHTQDHTEAYRKMLSNIDVVKLDRSKKIVPAYKDALESKRSTLLIEMADLYDRRI